MWLLTLWSVDNDLFVHGNSISEVTDSEFLLLLGIRVLLLTLWSIHGDGLTEWFAEAPSTGSESLLGIGVLLLTLWSVDSDGLIEWLSEAISSSGESTLSQGAIIGCGFQLEEFVLESLIIKLKVI